MNPSLLSKQPGRRVLASVTLPSDDFLVLLAPSIQTEQTPLQLLRFSAAGDLTEEYEGSISTISSAIDMLHVSYNLSHVFLPAFSSFLFVYLNVGQSHQNTAFGMLASRPAGPCCLF